MGIGYAQDLFPPQRRDCAPKYVRRRKTPLTYLFSGRPARLGNPKLSLKGILCPPRSIQPYKEGLGIAAQLVGDSTLRAGLEAVVPSDNANCAFIADAHKFESCTPLHGRGRDYRNTCPGDTMETMFENWPLSKTTFGLTRDRVFLEAMALLL